MGARFAAQTQAMRRKDRIRRVHHRGFRGDDSEVRISGGQHPLRSLEVAFGECEFSLCVERISTDPPYDLAVAPEPTR